MLNSSPSTCLNTWGSSAPHPTLWPAWSSSSSALSMCLLYLQIALRQLIWCARRSHHWNQRFFAFGV